MGLADESQEGSLQQSLQSDVCRLLDSVDGFFRDYFPCGIRYGEDSIKEGLRWKRQPKTYR